jgi:hypothetical protein
MPILRQGVVSAMACNDDCLHCGDKSRLCLARDHYVCLIANKTVSLDAVVDPYRNGGSERILSGTMAEYQKLFRPVGRHVDTNWQYEQEIEHLRIQTRELLRELEAELEAIKRSRQSV